MNLKSLLKRLKLNESTISMILGAIVIVVVGLLVVNYFKGLDTGTTLPVGEQTEIEGPTVTRGGETFHVVQAGENLWKIAERYYDSGYNWVDIASANNLSNPGVVELGQELSIPGVESKTPTVTVATTNILGDSAGSAGAIVDATYTVARGDSLWSIAIRAYGDGYRWVDIARENDLTNPSIIHSGNVLTLPR